MKKLIYVLALVGMLFSCSKNTNAPANEPETEVESETIESKQIEWHPICPEFESISVEIDGKTILHKVDEIIKIIKIPDTDNRKEYLSMRIKTIPNSSDVSGEESDVSIWYSDAVFLEFENAIAQNREVDNKNIMLYQKPEKIDNQPFLEIINLRNPYDSDFCFWVTYLTTTPKNKIEIEFEYIDDPIKGHLMYDISQEAPRYFERYDNGPLGWKDDQSIGLLAKNLANGTAESPTLNRLYNGVKQTISKIKIKVE
ncbi:MAG: hypothetical protein P1P59_11035 [Treponemataceae bacterium]